jgi:hypothetical protein
MVLVPDKVSYSYVRRSDNTLWNVGRIIDDVVNLWTMNAWGVTHRDSMSVDKFWREFMDRKE